MRILKVEIENINSLKGKWEIDFEHESFAQNHNQFVICGATGSGKTTILDAITLALYGKTPREDKVSKNENEILCKGTARCMAAVTYENNGERFRSEFSQSRARNSATGKLQNPALGIKNLTTGEVYEVTSVKNLEPVTVKLIGLNYDQFCKSVLLAQGSFSSFLKGDVREKAEILAKLNGTEDFKKAANLLWEKTKRESEDCEREINEIDAIETLSDEMLEEYNGELAAKNDEIAHLGEEESILNKMHIWRKELVKKEEELEKAKNAKFGIDTKIEQFKEERIVLERAEKAMNCEGQYVSYDSSVNKEAELLKAISVAKEGLGIAEKAMEEASIAQTNAKKVYDNIDSKKESNSALWNKVIGIDADLKSLKDKYDNQNIRADKAKQNFEGNNKTVSDLEKLVATDRARIAELDSYIAKHENDDKIEKLVSGLNEKKNFLSGNIANVDGIEKAIEKKEADLAATNDTCEAIGKDIVAMEEELKEFVSSNFKSISMVLRHSCLTDKSACPVCGSMEHPFLKDAVHDAEVVHSSDNNIAAKASELSSMIEKKQAEKNTLEQNIALLSSELSTIRNNLDKEKQAIVKMISEINDSISAWNLKVESTPMSGIVKSIEGVVGQLVSLSDIYNNARNEREEKLKDKSLNETKLAAINLKELEGLMKEEAKKADENYQDYSRVMAERKQLFSDKNVETEQARYNNELNTSKRNYDDAVTKYNNSKLEAGKASTILEETNSALERNAEALKQAAEALDKVIALNGFSSIDELKGARRESSVVEDLKTKRDNLETDRVACNTKLETAKGEYDSLIRENLTEDSIDVISDKLSQLKSNRDEANKRIGEINKIIADNDEKLQRKAGLIDRKNELKEKIKIYTNIRDIIGVKDGSEVEVFVQTMALSNLLVSANGYLAQILHDYSLVQKPKSLECLLHDANHPQDDRPISNLSGGETFAISLSLALGIAEIASHRIQIESLFLDEGFGTLSGEPLAEAIRALQQLRSTGKTLGIITHVQEVIDAFPMKITASKHNGVSSLSGDGITRG